MRPKTAQMVIDTFTKLIDEQCAKGLNKYGTTIDEAKNSDYDWNRMALEEAIDLAQYLVKENARLLKRLKDFENALLGATSYASELKKAVEFYADKKNWITPSKDVVLMDGEPETVEGPPLAIEDSGENARQALGWEESK